MRRLLVGPVGVVVLLWGLVPIRASAASTSGHLTRIRSGAQACGTQWTVDPSPNVPNVDNVLQGVGAISATDVWAVGWTYAGVTEPLSLHWDGGSWNNVP